MTNVDIISLIIILVGMVICAVILLLPYKYYTISDTLRIREISTFNYKKELTGVEYVLEIKTYFGDWFTICTKDNEESIKKLFESERTRLKGFTKKERIID